MRACIPGGSALLLLCVSGVHAQPAPRLQVGTPVRATLAGDGALRYELHEVVRPAERRTRPQTVQPKASWWASSPPVTSQR